LNKSDRKHLTYNVTNIYLKKKSYFEFLFGEIYIINFVTNSVFNFDYDFFIIISEGSFQILNFKFMLKLSKLKFSYASIGGIKYT